MLTPVERVMALKGIDLLANVGPRHLIKLATVAREESMWKGQILYAERDLADALYVVVDGVVKLTTDGRDLSEVGPGQAFGTWALIDESERGQQATCAADGLLLALSREDFYEVAADDLTLPRELLRILARRLRELVEERPEDARVGGEGVETAAEPAAPATTPEEKEAAAVPAGPGGGEQGASLESAVLDRPGGPSGLEPRMPK
jgi:CRP-like cAMP-binding protein